MEGREPKAMEVAILLIATISAILSGVAVFTNIAPEMPKPDPRIGELQAAIESFEEDINKTLEEMQKAMLLMEHRLGKDSVARKDELKAHLDTYIEVLLKAISDINEDEIVVV
jgi:hypothetical protein